MTRTDVRQGRRQRRPSPRQSCKSVLVLSPHSGCNGPADKLQRAGHARRRCRERRLPRHAIRHPGPPRRPSHDEELPRHSAPSSRFIRVVPAGRVTRYGKVAAEEWRSGRAPLEVQAEADGIRSKRRHAFKGLHRIAVMTATAQRDGPRANVDTERPRTGDGQPASASVAMYCRCIPPDDVPLAAAAENSGNKEARAWKGGSDN